MVKTMFGVPNKNSDPNGSGFCMVSLETLKQLKKGVVSRTNQPLLYPSNQVWLFEVPHNPIIEPFVPESIFAGNLRGW